MKNTYPISDHYDGKKFFNPGLNVDKPFSDLIKWNLNRQKSVWPEWIENTKSPNLQMPLDHEKVAVTFINHASFLLQTQKQNILFDPIFSKRASPLPFMGPKRIRKSGLEIDQLPTIHVVLISHNHYDHLDTASLKKIEEKFQPIYIVPLANAQYLKAFVKDQHRIKELDWWENHFVNDLKISLVPAQHWSARGLFDRREALWGGFVINYQKRTFYFVGDSGYNEFLFKSIHQKFGDIDLAFIPIGAYEPNWFMKTSHMNPEEAVHVHRDAQSKNSIAMHFGTFKMSDEHFDQPQKDLQLAIEKWHTQNLHIMDVGETRGF